MTDAEWNPIWTNFINQTGSTWGDYVSMLDANAAYLGTLGESVNDISQLLAFEFAQADGLGPMRTLTSAVDASVEAPGMAITFSRFFAGSISLRNDQGTLGYGWSNNWDYSLATSSDGTVTITGPGGSSRSFQPDSRTAGKYFSSLGDYSTLTTRSGGGYTLRESDGSLYAFTATGTLDYVEDTNANRITCGYTGGLLTSLTHSSGQYLHLSYTGGLLTGLVDQDGRSTSYSYDSSQRLVSVTDDTGAVTGYGYSGHDLTSVAYPGSTHRYFTYDSQGRIASASLDQDINKVSFSYDSTGTVFLTDALGNTTELYYDYRGLLVKATDPLGNIVSLSFDGNNNLSSITDAAGHSSYYSYDKKGNLIRSTDAAGHTTSMTYSGLYNRLSSLTDANGNTTLYGYDAKGNLSSITYANGASEQWSYNTLGSPTEWVNCRGSEVGYTYDSTGRITSKLYADGTTATFTYDSHGNLRTATNSDGATTFTYNSKDELTRVDYPGGQYLIFTYDGGGRRTSSADQLGHATNYQYDAAGRLSKVTDEHGTVLAAYSYDAAGRLSRKGLGNGVYTTYGYDAAGQLLHLINYNTDGSVVSRFDYTYDSRGRRTSMTTVDGAWTYEYDDIGQLSHAVFASGDPASIPNQDLRYVYDAMGNRTQTIENGVVTDYTVNNLNQYTKVGDTTYVFDLDGNLIQEISASGTTTYTYNSENQLTGISSSEGTWSYGYDALGNRVETTTNGVTTTSVIDPAGLGNIVGVYDAAGNLLTSYSYGHGLLTALSGTNLVYYTFDALGSTSELTDASGQVVNAYSYNPFGSLLQQSEAVANVFEFVGELGVMDDQNGLIYMRAREYDAGVGRFTQEDPINVPGGINLYCYAGNLTTCYIDPTGLKQNDIKFKEQVYLNSAINMAFGGIMVGGILLASGPLTVPLFILGVANGYSVFAGIVNIYNVYADNNEQILSGGLGEDLANSLFEGNDTASITGKVLDLTASLFSIKSLKDLCRSRKLILEFARIDYGLGTYMLTQSVMSIINGTITAVANSKDPNALTGPSGSGTDNYVATTTPFAYRIDFENDKTATAPAQQVTITNQLDANLDCSSFQLTEIAFGDTIISVPAGSSHFETTVSMSYNNKTFDVLVEAGINYATGLVTATFQSLDPDSELPPDVLTGFLPPEDGTGRGMGHVSYLIKAKQGLTTGTQIRNIALISFDGQTLIATNQVDPHDASKGTDPDLEALVTIDNDLPTSSVTSLPEITGESTFLVSWNCSDVGSGLGSYDIYVAVDNGAWTLWQSGTRATSATYNGTIGHTYSFYSIARDNAGNHEVVPTAADTQTMVISLNEQPVAVGDAFTGDENTLIIGTVLTNDSDADDDPLSAILVDGPANGSLILNEDGSFIYTPHAHFCGTDSFTYKVNDGQANSNPATVSLTVEPTQPLQVLSCVATATGFTLTFNHALDTETLNLYGVGGTVADLTLRGARSGLVKGSLVVDATGKTLTFIKTGGVLSAGYYTLTLRSAADGFKDIYGQLLDGNKNGTAGDAFVRTFRVGATPRTLSVGDFSRGPGQNVDIKAANTSSDLPIRLSNGRGITQVSFTLRYDPALLTIANILLGNTLPRGASLQFTNDTVQGLLTVSISSTTSLTTSNKAFDLVKLVASIPDDAPYRAKQILDLTDISLNKGVVPVSGDDGLQVVAYLGDATASKSITSDDYTSVSGVAGRQRSGFATYATVDPVLIADINGNGRVESRDALLILNETGWALPGTFGVNVAAIPDIPEWVEPADPIGPDPLVSIPTTMTAALDELVTVPVLVDPADGLSSAQITLAYDAAVLELVEVRRGAWTENFGIFLYGAEDGLLKIDMNGDANSVDSGTGAIAQAVFRVIGLPATGSTTMDLQRVTLNDGQLVLTPVSVPGEDATDGRVTITATAQKTEQFVVPVAEDGLRSVEEVSSISWQAPVEAGGAPVNVAASGLIQWQIPVSVKNKAAGNVQKTLAPRWMRGFATTLADEVANPNNRIKAMLPSVQREAGVTLDKGVLMEEGIDLLGVV